MTHHPLDQLLCPRTIAFVGASDRPDSTGAAMLAMCRIDGFDGVVYAVNPRLSELDGAPCYPDLAALPAVPDHVVIGFWSVIQSSFLLATSQRLPSSREQGYAKVATERNLDGQHHRHV